MGKLRASFRLAPRLFDRGSLKMTRGKISFGLNGGEGADNVAVGRLEARELDVGGGDLRLRREFGQRQEDGGMFMERRSKRRSMLYMTI